MICNSYYSAERGRLPHYKKAQPGLSRFRNCSVQLALFAALNCTYKFSTKEWVGVTVLVFILEKKKKKSITKMNYYDLLQLVFTYFYSFN